ncbi:hypothetical protein OH76DRAFT_1190364 [Lentinus brumalis]|uniref:Uncharacterized protein n=1 Tax=Lentinus brumalis TaxID=2498619 RepID=A0A371CTJ7_9APHY|nr:hypothetical protein OH76DRAFT_1190364 [Polyporus brumalis]
MGVDVDMMSSALYRGLVFYAYLVASLISLVHDACDEDVCGEPNSGAHSIYIYTYLKCPNVANGVSSSTVQPVRGELHCQ